LSQPLIAAPSAFSLAPRSSTVVETQFVNLASVLYILDVLLVYSEDLRVAFLVITIDQPTLGKLRIANLVAHAASNIRAALH
jgi:hypothetical protein